MTSPATDPATNPATVEQAGFHAHSGWYFRRQGPAGYVHIAYPGVNSPGIAFDPDTWASVVASVSAAGETAETWAAARAFHTTTPAGAVAPVDPAACEHLRFGAQVDVHRLTRSDTDPTVVGYSADIMVRCDGCGEPFRWIGPPAGLSPRHPAVSINGTELRAPLAPQSAPDGFGLDLPGFGVRMWVPDDEAAAGT